MTIYSMSRKLYFKNLTLRRLFENKPGLVGKYDVFPDSMTSMDLERFLRMTDSFDGSESQMEIGSCVGDLYGVELAGWQELQDLREKAEFLKGELLNMMREEKEKGGAR